MVTWLSPRRRAVRQVSCRLIVYALVNSKRKLPMDKVREGLLAGAPSAICANTMRRSLVRRAAASPRVGVASAMSAAFIAAVTGASPQVTENAAESALEHHLGMTCDPVAGLRAGSLHRALRLRRGEGVDRLPHRHQRDRVEASRRPRHDHQDSADTGRDMSTKYKETSEAGLAANLVLC